MYIYLLLSKYYVYIVVCTILLTSTVNLHELFVVFRVQHIFTLRWFKFDGTTLFEHNETKIPLYGTIKLYTTLFSNIFGFNLVLLYLGKFTT